MRVNISNVCFVFDYRNRIVLFRFANNTKNVNVHSHKKKRRQPQLRENPQNPPIHNRCGLAEYNWRPSVNRTEECVFVKHHRILHAFRIFRSIFDSSEIILNYSDRTNEPTHTKKHQVSHYKRFVAALFRFFFCCVSNVAVPEMTIYY